MIEPPEVACARRYIKKNKISYPIDIFEVLSRHAQIFYKETPLQIDGACVDLKKAGQTKVVINSRMSRSRMVFTAAHELGHIIIPWHTGSYVDVKVDVADAEMAYAVEEAEANRFASEILMPSEWIDHLIDTYGNPASITKYINETCQISPQAITIKLQQCLPAGYIYARTFNGEVVWSGKTRGTVPDPPRVGTKIFTKVFSGSVEVSKFLHSSEEYIWWKFKKTATPARPQEIDWRKTLDAILRDTIPDAEERSKLWRSINGQIASARSKATLDLDSIYTALTLKKDSIVACGGPYALVGVHPDFDLFLLQRSYSFVEEGPRKKK